MNDAALSSLSHTRYAPFTKAATPPVEFSTFPVIFPRISEFGVVADSLTPRPKSSPKGERYTCEEEGRDIDSWRKQNAESRPNNENGGDGGQLLAIENVRTFLGLWESDFEVW